MEIKTLNEQIERLRELIRKCYGVVASKNGIVPEVGERNMENLPNAIASTHDTLEELAITQNGEYIPQEGVDGFSKVVAEFDTSSLPKVKVNTLKVSDACINEDGIWGGEYLIDTSESTSFTSLFSGVNSIEELDLKSFNTSNVISMEQTFRSCRNLKKLDVSNWDTSKVTTFYYMFTSCVSLQGLDLTNWDVSSADKSNSFGSFFNSTTSLATLIGGRSIDDVLQNNISCLKNLKVTINLSSSRLDRASLRALINGLADLTGQTAQTLTLGATLIAKLTEEDIAIATSKNWTIV